MDARVVRILANINKLFAKNVQNDKHMFFFKEKACLTPKKTAADCDLQTWVGVTKTYKNVKTEY